MFRKWCEEFKMLLLLPGESSITDIEKGFARKDRLGWKRKHSQEQVHEKQGATCTHGGN